MKTNSRTVKSSNKLETLNVVEPKSLTEAKTKRAQNLMENMNDVETVTKFRVFKKE